MNCLRIKGIENIFLIEEGRIYSIDIENRDYYLSLVQGYLNEDDSLFIYSENYTPVEFIKKSLIITDIFTVDPNSKKILNSLYKKITNEFNDHVFKEEIESINHKIINVLNELSIQLNTQTEFETNLDINKILSLYKFSFNNNSSNILERLVTYLKANLEIMDLKFAVILNFLPLLCKQETELLVKELELLNVSLININFINKNNDKNINYLTIDDDLCEF